MSFQDSLANHPPQQQPSQQHLDTLLAAETQSHGVDLLLQNLERLENTGDRLFDSLALVGQGPPSLLAAQLVSMTQVCQQMRDDASASSLLNVPIAMADPVFAEATATLPRSQSAGNPQLKDVSDLGAWIQQSSGQTSELFAERRRLAANAQAALSVPTF
ncbi:hypothetical protein H4R26_003907 [Coemansia thaxteri]|uniref:Uncharacterized protein n=1 Tax=Coemansia thaxteri TaxID=2663907 RepID=A0A9W8BI50_9FUNG|nr:hypothetical protein H4R26_003907 [Coemansia thaxteri]KAJ2484553.1 hypothetical protein EV174_002343 [Coemansia sp. RSA 2320]